MTFSIIIPIYNAQSTLRRCLDSIQRQTYSQYEVLMIDDGSTDCSADIAESYVERDSRFRLIRQSNKGPSRARNCGLDLATGDVVSFIDSDDYVESDYLQEICSAFQSDDAQVVFFGVNQLTEAAEKQCTRNIPELPKSWTAQVIALTKADVFGYTWIKAISRHLIGDIRFDETLNLFEDEVFTCQIMQKMPAISAIRTPLYNQIVLQGSLSRKTHADYYAKCEAVYLAWKQLLQAARNGQNPILREKANHMTQVCKFYFLEKNVPPISFVQGLSRCTFWSESTIDDALVAAIKNKSFWNVLIHRTIYRTKMHLRNLTGR